MINPDESTLEEGEVTLDGVRMNIAAHIFALGVLHRCMVTEWRAEIAVYYRSTE